MAANYKDALLKIKPKRRFEAGAVQRWEYVMQWLLDKKCKGDFALLANVLSFALNHPEHTGAAQRGPHKIKARWHSLYADYTAVHSNDSKLIDNPKEKSQGPAAKLQPPEGRSILSVAEFATYARRSVDEIQAMQNSNQLPAGTHIPAKYLTGLPAQGN